MRLFARPSLLILALTLLAFTPVRGQTIRFEDRASEVGLHFSHADGRSGKRYLLETLGSGVALFDADGDGWLDVYCVSGSDLPGKKSSTPPRNSLYRNRGDGRFEDVTLSSGTGDEGYGFGCCAGDYDGDGRLDLYVTNFERNVLYRNLGEGKFEDVTKQAGVEVNAWSTGAVWLDYDGDQDLDLYVANYVAYRIEEKPKQCFLRKGEIAGYCHPGQFPALPDRLYRNNGDGTFSEVSAASGIAGQPGKGLGVVGGDYDGDGDTDIFVANDTTPNLLFQNQGGGRFQEIGLLAGVAYSEDGRAESGMGAALADFDGDGWLDFAVTNFARESNSLYRNHRGSYFVESSYISGTGRVSHVPMGWGTGFFDFDRDGRRDWFVVNGHLQDNVHLMQGGHSYPQENLLFRGLGGGKFQNASKETGGAMEIKAVGRGAAFGDLDNDGDVDIVISNANSALRYLRCEGSTSNRWLSVDLRQSAPNVFAIGARVTVRAGKLLLVDEVQAGGSYLSQNDLRLHFGLGEHAKVNITVRWPDGKSETREGVTSNQRLLWKR